MAIDDSQGYDLLDRLAEEFADRFRRGERPSLKEYTDRYPELADDIREVFPALVKVQQVEEICQDRGETEPAGSAVPPLSEVGDYRIIREVGHGGMGVVYEAEQVLQVQEALNALDPLDREVVALRHFEQLSRAETAQVLVISEEAGAKRYIRALKRLKAVLATMPGGLEGI